jgi:hypothetical protein
VSQRFTMVPHHVLERVAAMDLSGADLRVLCVVLRQSCGWGRDSTDRYCGTASLMQATGLARKTVRRSVRRLVDCGVLRVTRPASVSGDPASYGLASDLWTDLTPGDRSDLGTDLTPGDRSDPRPGDRSDPTLGTDLTPHKETGEETERERPPPAPHGASAGLQVGSWTGSPAGELWARFAGRDSRGALRRPSALQEQVACLILANNDPADIERAAQAVARRGWGWSAFVRCFPGDDCEFDESQLPQDKRRGKEDRGAEQLRRVLGDDVDVDYDVFAEVYGDG